MSPKEISNMLFTYLDTDFRAEVAAAELMEHNNDKDEIVLLPTGANKRTFSKDILAIEEELSKYNQKKYVLVKSPREGIYDMLPQGLFHRPVHAPASTEADLIKQVKLWQEEERHARTFFLPFESAINDLRIRVALYENRLDKRAHCSALVEIFAGHWEIFRYLDARQSDIFLHLIPIIHDIRDDHPVIESILETIFLLPVQIELRRQVQHRPAEPMLSRMGESLLGVNLTTGNALYDEGEDEILVRVGPMSNVMLQQFMPGQVNDKILQLLKDYLLPANLDVVTELVLFDKDRMTRLADEKSNLNAMLGGDTYL